MKRKIVVAISVLACLSGNSFAEDHQPANLNVGLTTGTTGTNIELSRSINDFVGFRVGTRVAGDLNRTTTLEGNEYKASFTPDTKSLLLDVYPFGGAFYLTGGLVNQDINFKLTGQAAGGSTYKFNNVTYNASDLGTFTGTAGFSKSTAPYLGLGWSNRNKQEAGFAFSFEAGVLSVGTGNATLNVTCGSALASAACSTLQSNVTAEQTSVNNDLNKSLYYPVIQLGVSYRF